MTDDDSNVQWRAAISRPVDIDPFRPLSSAVSLQVAAASVCGKLRPYNTDHYLAIRLGRMQETMLSSLRPADLPPRFEEFAYALLVADGLGERGAGARASRIALSAVAHLAIRYGRWNVRVDADTTAEISEQGAFLYRRVHDAVLEASRADERLSNMATSLVSCVTVTSRAFSLLACRVNKRTTASPCCQSRAAVGSSARMMDGPCRTARAMATRCRCPPLTSPGLLFRSGTISRSSRICPSRLSSRERATPAFRPTMRRLSSTVRNGSSCACWNTKPM